MVEASCGGNIVVRRVGVRLRWAGLHKRVHMLRRHTIGLLPGAMLVPGQRAASGRRGGIVLRDQDMQDLPSRHVQGPHRANVSG